MPALPTTSLSWVLAAHRPEALARFYAALFQTDHRPGVAAQHWLVDLPGGGVLQLYRPSRTRDRPTAAQALAPCLQHQVSVTAGDPLEPLHAMVEAARQLGATVVEPARQEPFGAECWLADPEGNRLLLLCTAASTAKPHSNDDTTNNSANESTLATACRQCQACDLAGSRRQVVISRGSAAAALMLIGEAPGASEDAEGRPFVGRSGRLLDQLLRETGFNPDHDLYVCNAVKCRPPGNRKPKRQELAACRPWLEQQIALVNPAVVVLLGSTALAAVLEEHGPITGVRGQWIERDGRAWMPLFHPSYLLRNPSTEPGRPLDLTRSDLRQIRERLCQGEAAFGAPSP
jgi:uracil-DNA glycosylase family 4